MKQEPNVLSRLTIIILLVSVLTSCNSPQRQLPAETQVSGGKTGVNVFEVKPIEAATDKLIPAVLSVEETVTVLAQRDGIIKGLYVEEGQRVTNGQVLAMLDDQDLQTQLRESVLEVNRLIVDERTCEATARIYRTELDQEKSLLQDGLTSRRQFDRAEFKLDAAVQESAKAHIATQMAQAKVDAVKIAIEKTVIRSPITGVVTHRNVNSGANAVKNDKLFEISRLSPLQVKFRLPEVSSSGLVPGNLVQLSLVDQDRVIGRARIRRLDAVADASTNTRGYVADVLDSAGLVPGLGVSIHLPARGEAAVWVPRAAFPAAATLANSATNTLFLLEGDRCVARQVRVSGTEGDQVAVSSGLEAGDRIIFAPPAGLKPGDVVEVRRG